MEGPGLPDSVASVLQCLDINGKQLTWNISNTDSKTTLTMVWTSPPLSNLAPTDVRQKRKQQEGRSDTHVDQVPTAALQKVKFIKKKGKTRKKKSPSRLARDWKRLREFRNRKKQGTTKTETEPQKAEETQVAEGTLEGPEAPCDRELDAPHQSPSPDPSLTTPVAEPPEEHLSDTEESNTDNRFSDTSQESHCFSDIE